MSDDIHSPTNAGPAEIGQSGTPGGPAPTPTEATTEFFAPGADGGPVGDAPGVASTDLGEGPARPELLVAGAFAGGLLTAMILRRLGG